MLHAALFLINAMPIFKILEGTTKTINPKDEPLENQL